MYREAVRYAVWLCCHPTSNRGAISKRWVGSLGFSRRQRRRSAAVRPMASGWMSMLGRAGWIERRCAVSCESRRDNREGTDPGGIPRRHRPRRHRCGSLFLQEAFCGAIFLPMARSSRTDQGLSACGMFFLPPFQSGVLCTRDSSISRRHHERTPFAPDRDEGGWIRRVD